MKRSLRWLVVPMLVATASGCDEAPATGRPDAPAPGGPDAARPAIASPEAVDAGTPEAGSRDPRGRDAGCLPRGALVAPSTLSASFAALCAGCHGASGGGVGEAPALPGTLDLASFLETVRGGKGTGMPSWSRAHVDDLTLVADYATLTGRAVPLPPHLECIDAGGAPDAGEAHWTPERIEDAIRVGLAAFRRPDRHEGAACADCHGPMPMDLASIGYDDGTIMRRALLHVDQEDGQRIIDLVHAIRARYGLEGPHDFHAVRPFQPGGQPLEGATAAESDHAFGLALAAAAPTLAGPPIDTLEGALRARDELLKLDPRTFPIGIALNRWTEDAHHGGEHASLNEWLPDRPHVPLGASSRRRLHALHDAYLAAPSWDAMWAISDALDELTEVLDSAGARDLLDAKYRSVLFAQHQFLLEAKGEAGYRALGGAPFPRRNSIWDVGEFARRSLQALERCSVELDCVSLPEATLSGLGAETTLTQELERLELSWLWTGWLFDVTLYHTDRDLDLDTETAHYFTEVLYEHGYFNHITYMRFRKNLAVAYEPNSAPFANGIQRVAHFAAQNYYHLLAFDNGTTVAPEPGERYDLYQRLLANSMRMMLRLMLDEVTRTGEAYDPVALSRHPDELFAAFLGRVDGADLTAAPSALSGQALRDQTLLGELRAALATATDIQPD